MKTKKYKSIFISDLHLGTQFCKAEQLNDFLKHNSCETLYLVGDIIDGWAAQQNKLKWSHSHSQVVRRILKLANKTNVIYVVGNHDEFLRPMVNIGITFGQISVVNQCDHIGIDGKKYLVTHGDLFDGVSNLAPWLSLLGNKGYDIILSINSKFNWVRHKLGFGYWSISKYLKHKVKQAVDFMFQFEVNLTDYCKKRGYDGVIVGHIHHAEIKLVNDIIYMNDGDWVESMSALVENHDGTWEIIYWTTEVKNVEADITSSEFERSN